MQGRTHQVGRFEVLGNLNQPWWEGHVGLGSQLEQRRGGRKVSGNLDVCVFHPEFEDSPPLFVLPLPFLFPAF